MANKIINIDFISKLFALLSDQDNSVSSPYGIAVVLSMAAEGASGNCLNEILRCLVFDTIEELRDAVVDAIRNPCAAFNSKNAVTLHKGGNGVELCEQFKRLMAHQYAADIEEKMLQANQLWNCLTLQYLKHLGQLKWNAILRPGSASRI